MAAMEITVKVARQIFPQTYHGQVSDKSKYLNKSMFLPDEVRQEMPGEKEAWFLADRDGDKITFKRRVPKPDGWDNSNYDFCC